MRKHPDCNAVKFKLVGEKNIIKQVNILKQLHLRIYTL